MIFLYYIYLYLWICRSSYAETNGNIDEVKNHRNEDGNNPELFQTQDEILLPIPPKLIEIKPEELDPVEAKSLPKYIRLPKVDAVKVGYEREVEVIPGVNRTVRSLSMVPAVFEVGDFFDEDECDLLIELAKRKKMKDLHDTSFESIIQGAPEKTFKTWDINEDGFVDTEEMALTAGKTIIFTAEDADIMYFMLKMDKNEDGKMDLDELTHTDLSDVKDYIEKIKNQPGRERNTTTRSTWVWHDEDEILRFQDDYYDGYHGRIASLTGLPEELISESEPLQVQHFQEHQFTQCKVHSDDDTSSPCCQYGEFSDCRLCRYISMVIFLNDVEEGGEMVFPMADHQYANIMNASGEWRGYFTYAKTTGAKNRFTIDMQFLMSGANRIITGEGKDSGGNFELKDGIIIGNTVKFQKAYISTPVTETSIQYSGKILSGSRIMGNWWVPGKKRFFGDFFMWNRNYNTLTKVSTSKCNNEEYCTKSGLVVKPKRGKLVYWYNHHLDHQTGMVGRKDNDALIGHCSVVKGEKWIATSWLNVIGDGEDELRAWRRGINWLNNKEKHSNILDKIGSDASRVDPEDYKIDFERYKLNEIKNENITVRHDNNNRRKLPSNIVNAVESLLKTIDKKGLEQIASVVHRKLRLTCVPFYAEEAGKLVLKDGSKAH